MLRPDFKHSIISPFSSPLWKYPSPSYVCPETEYFGLRFHFKPKPDPVTFLILSSRLPFASLKVVLKMSPTSCSGSLLRISVIIWEPILRILFYSLCPWTQKSLNKKTHVALIILIIALQFDVSTSCNEEIKINEMNKNCILFLFYFRPSKGSLWLHSGQLRNQAFPVVVVT